MAVTRSPVDVAILLDLLFALAFDIHPMAHFKTIGPKPPLADVLNASQQRHQNGHSHTTQHSWLGKTAPSNLRQCRI